MPLSSSFTDEGGGFASFLHQVQKSYVPERDIDGRKFTKAMTRLRAKLSQGFYGEDNQIPKPTIEEYEEITSGHGHH